MSDHWIQNHFDEIRQLEHLDALHLQNAQLAAQEDLVRLELASFNARHDEAELLRRQTAPCPRCGNQIGLGGFCTNCNRPEESVANLEVPTYDQTTSFVDSLPPGSTVDTNPDTPLLDSSQLPEPVRQDTSRIPLPKTEDSLLRAHYQAEARKSDGHNESTGHKRGRRDADSSDFARNVVGDSLVSRSRVEPPRPSSHGRGRSHSPTTSERNTSERGKTPPHSEPSGEHRFFCTNCQTNVSSAGYCPACGLLLKKVDDASEVPLDTGTTTGTGYESTLLPQPQPFEFSKGYLNTVFMEDVRTTITKPGHRLHFLIDGHSGTWLSREKHSQTPTIQAGHLVSRHAGRGERFALEDSTFNQWSSNKGERQGAIFVKTALDIDGVPVERRTALLWERAGLLPPGTVAAARPHPGWTSR